MNDKNTIQSKPAHNIIMENRRILSVSGVIDVESFDEHTIKLTTQLGGLEIRGSAMHIGKIDRTTGETSIDGEIASLQYEEEELEPVGFWSRLFR